MRIEDLPLLPTPRTRESLPGLTDPGVKPVIETGVAGFARHDEYEIIATNKIMIRAQGDTGVRAALQTLSQIRASATSEQQAFRIRDWAAFANRGFMLDVSRDRIPTMPELKKLVSLLASLKYNHLQLYIEHTFAYTGHEAIWGSLDPIMPEQIRQLELWCKEAGIELAANQNCFGHLAYWLKHPDYSHLAETHGEFDFFGMSRTGPFSLSPTNPESINLVRDWITQIRECHHGSWFNIGCDETADVGTGHSKSRVDQLGYARVYSDYVNQVADVCKEHSFKPMFWADIAASNPESLSLLDNSMTALVWGYEPDSIKGETLAALSDHGFESWVCPGSSCWRSFTGRTAERKANIHSAANVGVENGCTGFMLTAWGDLGHRQQWPITLRAIADGAQSAWAGGGAANQDAVDMHVFDSPASGIADWLDELGDADIALRKEDTDTGLPRLLNASAFFHELHPAHESIPSRGSLKQWQHIRNRLESLRGSIPAPADRQLARVLAHSLQCAEFAAATAMMRRGGPVATGLDDLIAEHESLWLLRSRPAGLEVSSGYYRALQVGRAT